MIDYLKDVLDLKQDHQISCLIPAWNEVKNISEVLKSVRDFPAFDEILVIDDGSTDETVKITNQFITGNPKFILLTHEINRGKTAAVLTGMKKSKSDLIVTIDADLIGLSHENMAKMIYSVLHHDCDLAILDRAGDRSAVWGWTNCARFFGGERAFWKKDFNEMVLPETGGYLLEIIMNLHYIQVKKKIKNIYCSNLYTVHQYDKVGTMKGYQNYLKMAVKIVRKATLTGFITQIKNIESDYPVPVKESWSIKNLNLKAPDIQFQKHYQEYKDKLVSQYLNLRESWKRINPYQNQHLKTQK